MPNYSDRGEQKRRRLRICRSLDIEPIEYERHLVNLYTYNAMSGHEIVEYIKQNTGEDISARSIQRLISKYGASRNVGDAYRNAIRKGRVTWAYKDKKVKRVKLNKKRRYAVLERDGFRCVKCGADPSVAILEVDHIIALVHGGDSSMDNLQTLCLACNQGKKHHKNER